MRKEALRKVALRKVVTFTLAGAMAIFCAACSGGSNAGETRGSQPADTQRTGGETSDKANITFMIPYYYGTEFTNEYADEVIARYEEYTNTHVEWQLEADDTYKEKFGLTLMDKDNMPMILTAKGDLTSSVIDAAKKGAFWDLTPYLQDSERYPNLSQANENVIKALTVDGEIIGIYRARVIGRNGFSYRTDWAEAVGITEAPKTIEDVYDMFWKFTYEDPDGNGMDDTYGLEVTKYTGPWDIIQTWFGCGNEWIEQEGNLVPVHQTAEFKEAVHWIRKIYEEGLIRQDWATVDTGTYGDATKKGETGAYIDVMDSGKRIWNYYTINDVRSVTDPSTTATMTLVGPINNATLATSGFNGYYLITKAGAKTEEDLRNCLHFLDNMCDDEMMILADYGLEGITYDVNENGNIVLREELEVQQTPQVGLNQSISYIPNYEPQSQTLVKAESTLAQDAAYKRNLEVAVFNPALGYLANSEINTEVGQDIEQIIDDARTQFICGQIDWAGFEKAAQQWLDRGGEQLMKEVNELHQDSE